MRLWHQDLIPHLDCQRLLGQHRECCALRGRGWGKRHSVVDYVFKYDLSRLYEYHCRVMAEMLARGYEVDAKWFSRVYRGKSLPCAGVSEVGTSAWPDETRPVYREHDDAYFAECALLLKAKGARLVDQGGVDERLFRICVENPSAAAKAERKISRKEMRKKMKISAIIAAFAVFAVAGCIDTSKPAGKPSAGTSAVVVGVENGYAGACPGSLKDAADMAELLKGYAAEVVTLTDNAASAAAVKAALEKAVGSELAIFYFSGHGGTAGPGGLEEEDGLNECIFCYDRAMVDDDIWKIVSRAKGRVFMVFDCCHSETMFRTPGFPFSFAATPRFARGRDPSMLCWSGCPDSDYSYGSSAGGAFTIAIRKYAEDGRSYDDVWSRVSSDRALTSRQSVRSTRLGSFDEGAAVFR